MDKLTRLEQAREAEKDRQASRSRSNISSSSYKNQQESIDSVNDVCGSVEYEYSYADFGPPLSASPNVASFPPLSVSASTPPSKTFANMALNAASASSSWGRQSRSFGNSAWVSSSTINNSGIIEEDISSAWRLEIPDTVLAAVASGSSSAVSPSNQSHATVGQGSGKKKKPQKIVLLGNGGSRGALFNH